MYFLLFLFFAMLFIDQLLPAYMYTNTYTGLWQRWIAPPPPWISLHANLMGTSYICVSNCFRMVKVVICVVNSVWLMSASFRYLLFKSVWEFHSKRNVQNSRHTTIWWDNLNIFNFNFFWAKLLLVFLKVIYCGDLADRGPWERTSVVTVVSLSVSCQTIL